MRLPRAGACGVALLLLLGACASQPQRSASVPPAPEVCERQPLGQFGRREWTSDRRETELVLVEVDVTPCSQPGGEVRIRVAAAGLTGIGCWDDAGIELHSPAGRGVLMEDAPPKIVASEGGEALAALPHFEGASGPWGIFMRRWGTFGAGHRMMFDAIARIRPDAAHRTIEMQIEFSANRNDFETGIAHTVFVTRTASARIDPKCGEAGRRAQ